MRRRRGAGSFPRTAQRDLRCRSVGWDRVPGGVHRYDLAMSYRLQVCFSRLMSRASELFDGMTAHPHPKRLTNFITCFIRSFG
ncbi:hypothetical protein GUJ93_ZPchr0001g30895 [Zizania palustris]|uniref:Uncharacterized protein n=1 Tax=Zizania palustris TaxID=103762 RepID=A0A8J5RYE4_ZIZPA|nr:hypothetical protein GUJ93_ZPchr0001g30895 [Zizania palustris]